MASEQPSGGTNTSVASNITYEPFGPYNGLTNGNGVAEARGFDQDYRLTGITDIGGSSTLQSLTYGYYPTNNVQTITNAVASNQNTGSANMSYGYGTGSDLLASLSMGGTVVQTIGYTADGRIASLNPGIQAPTGQYITSLSYNQDGRLTSVNAGAGTLTSYTYDGFEQRLIKTVSGSYGEIYQYGQDGALLEETDSSGAAQADYIYLNRRPVAVVNGSTLDYLHDDMLGTPQLATDSNQTVQWQASYDAFGQASVSGTVTQNLRLPGQYFDVESGWNHNGFRDYMPVLGRYAEPDPLGRLGSRNNLYAYVYDNPANLIDPLGLQVTIVIGNRTYSPTGNSVSGTISVTSDQTSSTFSGYTMENASAGDAGNKPPIPAGTYDAFVRTDHTPNRIELENVPGYRNIQIHNGSYPRNFKGCFGAGTSHSPDFLGGTVNAINRINSIIRADGSGNITVIVGPVQ